MTDEALELVRRDITEETILVKQTWYGDSEFRTKAGKAQIFIDPFPGDNPPRDNGWSGDRKSKNSIRGGDR